MKKAFSKLAGLLAMALLVSVLSMTASAASTTLSFTAPEDVAFQLYSAAVNFSTKSGNTAVTATSTETADGITTYSYVGLDAGYYYYTASGDGYYTVKKNVYYSEAEAAVGGTIDANPGKLAGGGFEPALVNDHTDELNAAVNQSATTAWPGYEHIFDTPYFTRADYAERMATGNGKHQQTTQEEMMAFLDEIDDENDDVYTYNLGKSPVYGYDIPILIFTKTDLSGAKTLEEAAALVRANGKLTFHLSAEVHADEVASGEVALAMIDELDKEYGQELMETINIYVIPRINPDGAHDYVRTNVSQGIDMNRDYMYSQSEEVTMVLYVKQLFMAEVAVDEHEFNHHDDAQPSSGIYAGTQSMPDLYIGQSGSQNNESVTNDLVNEVIGEVFETGFEAGIRPFYYPPYTTAQYTRGRGHYSLTGTVGILFESRGINYGLHMIERRIYSLYVGTEHVLEWAVENADRIKAEVARARADIISKGESYDEDDLLVLEHDEVPVEKAYSNPKYNMATGEMVDVYMAGPNNRSMLVAKTTRVRPTAYVIPAGNRWTQEALDVLDKHSISYYKLPAGAAVSLQQYKGDETGAELLAETVVSFPDGAYVMPMNQVSGTVLGLFMEPDVLDADGTNCTLVQSGVINPSADGTLPIYRYIHDLEEDGTVAVDLSQADTSVDEHGDGWIAINTPQDITADGKYYLTADIVDSVLVGSSYYGIALSGDVTLCLHGHNIEVEGLTAALRSKGNNVTIQNCTSEGGHIKNSKIRSVLVSAGNLTMEDNVHVDGASITGASGTVSAVQINDGAGFTMKGGSIKNNDLTLNASGSVGAIVALKTGTVRIEGGTIGGNVVTHTAPTDGTGYAGAVVMTSGALSIGGNALIEDNRIISSVNGAAVVVPSGATLTMTDGVISANAGKFGRGVLTYGSFTMSGGSIFGNNTEKQRGAGVYVGDGTFTLSGGTISKNDALSSVGAGVHMEKGTFNMTGGTITGNTTTNTYGGGLCVQKGTFNMTGGTIAGNTKNAVYGIDICNGFNGAAGGTITISGGTIGADKTNHNLTVNAGSVTLKGDAIVNGLVSLVGVKNGAATLKVQENACVNGDVINSRVAQSGASAPFSATTLEISGGSVDGSIYVDTTPHPKGERGACTTTISGGKFSESPSDAFLADGYCVTALDPAEGKLIYTVEKAEIDTPEEPEWKKELQKLIDSKPTLADCANHAEGWIKLDSDYVETHLGAETANVLYLSTGKYYLTENLTFEAGKTIQIKGDVTLCFNGCTLQGAASPFVRTANDSGVYSLSLCDCSEAQTGTLTSTAGYGITVTAGDTLNLFSGSISGCNGNSGVNNNGTFNMVGGKIANNTGKSYGGGLNSSNAASVFNMYGGEISGNTATGNYGGIYANNAGSTVNLIGGVIKNNENATSSTTKSAGGVYIVGTLNMYGGEISGNIATGIGGGVTVYTDATMNMYGGTISGNKATLNGSGVYNAGTFTMYGGHVDNNKCAGTYGAGVYTKSTFKMEGGTISGNEGSGANGGGAVYLTSTGVFEMSGGVISGNKAGGSGYGAIYVNNQFTMTGGTISGNNYVTGGVHVVAGKTFTMTGGSIGDKVYAGSDTSIITISGGKFGANMTRDDLAAFLPEESGTMTTVYSVMDYADPDGKLVYQVGEGLYSEAEDKFMDFGSSLDLGVVLNAHRNFNVADFAGGYTVSASSADRIYEASFDTTVSGSLLLMAHGIAAKEMHDAITFTVKKGDAVWFEKTLSVYDVAKLWHGDEDTSDQTMLADMIAYGNAARKEFKYNYAEGDVLPTLDGASSAVTEEWSATEDAGVSNGQQNKVAVTLSLKDQIELNIYINDKAAQISDVKFDGADYAADNYTVDTTSGKYTRVSFFNIPVVDVKKAVEFTVTLSEGTQFTMKYSIADYAVLAKNGNQGVLIQELMEYVDSVSAYLK